MSKTKNINGVTVTITQAKSNYVWLGILSLLTIGSIIGIFAFPIFDMFFGALALAFGLITIAMLKAITIL